jgi:hypothetical protein
VLVVKGSWGLIARLWSVPGHAAETGCATMPVASAVAQGDGQALRATYRQRARVDVTAVVRVCWACVFALRVRMGVRVRLVRALVVALTMGFAMRRAAFAAATRGLMLCQIVVQSVVPPIATTEEFVWTGCAFVWVVGAVLIAWRHVAQMVAPATANVQLPLGSACARTVGVGEIARAGCAPQNARSMAIATTAPACAGLAGRGQTARSQRVASEHVVASSVVNVSVSMAAVARRATRVSTAAGALARSIAA